MSRRLSLAISPCPNDTFVFHALVHGLVPGAPAMDVTFADVDVTNTAARQGAYDLVKVSYAALPWLGEHYTPLPCGGALGKGKGPLVLARQATLDLPRARIAIPGERTTAYLLFRRWAGDRRPALVETLPFHEIMPAVTAGAYDAGLVIHEARFTYPRYGLQQVVDLGDWWTRDTGLPVPLGVILARRSTVDPVQAAQWVRASLQAAWDDPAASREYVRAHAQEMDPEVIQHHIDTYVNSYSLDIGLDGQAAIGTLLAAGKQ